MFRSFSDFELCVGQPMLAVPRAGGTSQTAQTGVTVLPNRAVPCTFVVQPVNSFSCSRAKDSFWDANRTRLRRIHGNGSGKAVGGREVDRNEGRGCRRTAAASTHDGRDH